MFCDHSVFQSRWAIAFPQDAPRIPFLTDENIDRNHCVTEREAREIDLRREIPVVAPAEVFQDTRSWVHDQYVMKGTEETPGGQCGKLFQPPHDHYFVVDKVCATDEDVETVHGEGGVKTREVRRCHQVFRG